VDAADEGADRGAADDVGLDARLLQHLDRTDVRPAARRAAAERQPDPKLVRPVHHRGILGSIQGGYFPLYGSAAPTVDGRRRAVDRIVARGWHPPFRFAAPPGTFVTAATPGIS